MGSTSRAAKGLVAHRRVSHAVVQVGEADERQCSRPRQFREQQGERNRVGTARQADQDTAVRRAQPVPPNRVQDALRETSHLSHQTCPLAKQRGTGVAPGAEPKIASKVLI